LIEYHILLPATTFINPPVSLILNKLELFSKISTPLVERFRGCVPNELNPSLKIMDLPCTVDAAGRVIDPLLFRESTITIPV
jgi:hypothetical protein